MARQHQITPRMDGTDLERAHFRIKALRSALSDITLSDAGPGSAALGKMAHNALVVDDSRATMIPEEECPGHVAWEHNPKICGRCGIHIDSLRPEEPEGP